MNASKKEFIAVPFVGLVLQGAIYHQGIEQKRPKLECCVGQYDARYTVYQSVLEPF